MRNKILYLKRLTKCLTIMLRLTIFLLLFTPQLVFSQTDDPPFQVLVAEGATIFGKQVEPLIFVDDVTSIEIEEGGFLALVHKGGTTYELKEKVFTFYLKPEKLKDLWKRPELEVLYDSGKRADLSDMIEMIHPNFDSLGIVNLLENEPIELYWHLQDEPVVSYKLRISDHTGKKIQDFGTRKNVFVLKPYNFGLQENEFIVQLSSTLAGETNVSKKYYIRLQKAPKYPVKASDLVLKALNVEVSPAAALEVWKEVLGTENGKYYFKLFELFVSRNKEALSGSNEEVELLLSQNR